jgi:NAD-dependent deacetylase
MTAIPMSKKKLILFSGAGISAESGLQTFRDADGLWEGHRVEDVATPRAWKKNPEQVLRFYNERRSRIREVQPNEAHLVTAHLQEKFDVTVITQNIDDLHERAGAQKVIHLHGEIFKMRSDQNDSLIYPILDDIQLGDKADDGAQLRPHIVWFDEPVPLIQQAISMTQDADIFVVVGTSLSVYPAASLVQFLPDHVPMYVVDKKIPGINRSNLILIEKKATEGMLALKDLLLKQQDV